MKRPTYEFTLPARSGAPAIKSVILYEDLESGINGKVFCELLAEEVARGCDSSSSLWRMNILEHACIAADAAADAERSDFIVVSLSGDEDLPAASRRWLEAQVQTSGHGKRCIILLTSAHATLSETVERTREWLSHICVSSDIEFFAYRGELTEGESGVCFSAEEQNGKHAPRETDVLPLQLAIP